MARTLFPRVKEAREALADKALDIFNAYMEMAKKASESGDHKAALEAMQFLMEHMPSSPEGESLLDGSVDRKQIESKGPSGPQIQIGIALGTKAPALPPASSPIVEVIDVTDDDSNSSN